MRKYKSKHTFTKPLCVASLVAIMATFAHAEDIAATASNSAYLLGDYYHYDMGNGSADMTGGTAGYSHQYANGNAINAETTVLSGTSDAYILYDGVDHADSTFDFDEVRVSLMCSLSSMKYFSFGVEYIHDKVDTHVEYHDLSKHLVNTGTEKRPKWEWDNTYTDNVTKWNESSDINNVFAKISVNYPIRFFETTNSSLYIKPRMNLSTGYEFGDGDNSAVYICEGLASLVYEYGHSSFILDGGYRYLGYFNSDSDGHCGGVLARVGYSYSW